MEGLFCVDAERRAVNALLFSGFIMGAVLGAVDFLLKKLFISLIKGYRFFISPLFGGHCRFQPTCSQYALDSLATKSIFGSLKLIVIRISKCHPFHRGGYDPVK